LKKSDIVLLYLHRPIFKIIGLSVRVKYIYIVQSISLSSTQLLYHVLLLFFAVNILKLRHGVYCTMGHKFNTQIVTARFDNNRELNKMLRRMSKWQRIVAMASSG